MKTCLFRPLKAIPLALLFFQAQPGLASPVKDLAPGHEVRCGMTPGQVDSYRTLLDAGTFARLDVEQRGSDVQVTLKDSSGRTMKTVDISGEVGKERVLWIPESPGHYVLELVAGSRSQGCYTIALAEPREAAESDRLRVAAADLTVTSRKDGSIEGLQEALSLWRRLNEPWWEAETLGALSELVAPREPDRSARLLERALEISSDPVQRGYARYSLSFYYSDQGRWKEALEQLEFAQQHWTGMAGAEQWRARTLTQLGLMNEYLGHYGTAMDSYSEALELCGEGEFPVIMAAALHNRARIRIFLRQWDNARRDLEESIALKRKAERPVQRSLVLKSYVDVERGDPAEAIRLLQEVLHTRLDPVDQANAWIALGHAQAEAGELRSAERSYQKAHSLYQGSGDEFGVAAVDYRFGRMRLRSGDGTQALASFEAGLREFRDLGDLNAQAESLLGIARSLRLLGRREESRAKAEEALGLVENLRSGSEDERLRSMFFSSRQHFFDFYIDLLMEMHKEDPDAGFDDTALETSERARASSLLEAVERSGADPRDGVEAGLAAQEVEALEKYLQILRVSFEEPFATTWQDPFLRAQQELESVRRRIRKRHPVYAALTSIKTVTVAEIREKVLDRDTALLEYHLGKEKSYLWYVTADGTQAFELPSRAVVEEAARGVRERLPSPYAEITERELAALSEMVLGPVYSGLKAKRLLVVGDGELQYVPFAALPFPGSYDFGEWPERLISRYEIVNLPSVSILEALRERRKAARSPKEILVVGDPVTTDPNPAPAAPEEVSLRDSEPVPPELVYAKYEVAAIRSRYPEMDPQDEATRYKATREEVMKRHLENYRIIHFVTHATFDDSFPERSHLVLSRFDKSGRRVKDWRLYLPEVYQLHLGAELVVLSACETALGQEVRGEGLVGMAHGFMHAGAARVVASLWSVPDDSTMQLMSHFYQHLVGGLPAAAALRSAQQDFLELHKDRQAPKFWAGFVVLGDF